MENDIEQARASNMENDIEQARASNMEEDKASSPNNGKYIDEGNASDIEMATNIVEKLDNELSRVPKPLRDVNSSRASNMENDIEEARASNMENDIEEARASNMENDIEQARASNMENDIEEARATNMEEDKASSANKGKYIDVGNASDIKMAKDILGNIVKKLDNEGRLMSFQPNSSESPRSEYCIYRVPNSFRNVKPEAYTPQLISIGPLHRGNERLEAMEKEKLKYFEKLTERSRMRFKKKPSKKMYNIVISIKKQEERLRNCYPEKFDEIKSNDFVEMILLDAVFIIQFFLESIDEKGPKSCKPRMTIFDIREDLMLLENQLPLSIIEKIYDQVRYSPRLIRGLVFMRIYKHKSFLDLATCYLREYLHLQGVETSPGVKRSGHITDLLRNLMLFKTSPDVEKETSLGVKRSRHFTDLLRNLMLCKTSQGVEKETSSDVETETSPGVKKEPMHLTDLLRNLMLCKTSQGVEKETSVCVRKETSPGVEKEPRHLTDLLRDLMLSSAIQRSYSRDLVRLNYSAILLRKAGVTFQVTRHECLVNIKFDKGVLKIPHLIVDQNFDRLVRNIMTMEQCLYEHEAYICSYIKFMAHLIGSAADVGLLVENGIILHSLGDDATVANMINNLCKNIGDNDTCFGNISQELNAHYENPWNHRNAPLKLVYFPNIWTGMGTVAAAILLILTLIQTIKAFF